MRRTWRGTVIRTWVTLGVFGALGILGGCRDDGAGAGQAGGTDTAAIACDCGTVVVAAVGEPAAVLPPLVYETVGRDIGDLVFERLADLKPGGVPIDSTAYAPRLAERWERVDSLTWRFHLRPGARWHDGRPVTADDVVFSFEVFADPAIDAAARPTVGEGRITALPADSATVLLRFAQAYPEQLYDATYHVRIVPKHVWGAVPRDRWAGDTSLARLVGSGPYRVAEWRRGEFLRLERADTALRSAPRRVVWRFAADPDAALNLLLAGEADVMEAVGAPDRVARVERQGAFETKRYPAAVYGFLAFRVNDAAGRPHPVLGDVGTRRALALAVDRPTLARAVFGPGAAAPPGPMSRLLWIWSTDSIRALPLDTAQAVQLLDSLGWRRPGAAPPADAPRVRGTRPLAFDILVPSTSGTRRQLAQILQETWRQLGARVTVTAVDFPVFQQRLAQGQFDSYIGAYLDEPSPRSLADQWTRAGWDGLNHGRYASAAFDTLLARAARSHAPAEAFALYHQAMDTLNAHAPAIFLYTPENVAAVHRRLRNVVIDPYSWISRLPEWSIDPRMMLARDSVR